MAVIPFYYLAFSMGWRTRPQVTLNSHPSSPQTQQAREKFFPTSMDKIPGRTLPAFAWVTCPTCADHLGQKDGVLTSAQRRIPTPPSARKSAPDGVWDIVFPGKIEKVATTLYPTTMLFCTISWLIVYIFVAKLEAPMARTVASVSWHPFTPSTMLDEHEP